MMKRKLLLAALAFSSIGAVPVLAPMPALADTRIYIDAPPPPVRHEVVPAHRRGYVWQPGYWDWRGGRHVWVKGYWVKERPNMYWHPHHWVQRDGRWVLERGRWDRQRYAARGDRDGDGIPNRVDPNPNVPNRVARDRDGDGIPNRIDPNPNVPNRVIRDRDRDGVPDRLDARPDNPYRQ